jgi:hexosaminidase
MDTLRTLADEVIAMFPNSHYLHIRGDEAAIGEWANCADCVKYMEENGIDGPRPLYTEFIKRMTDMVLEMGKTPIVWEGFNKKYNHLISKNVIVIAWESYYQLAPDFLESDFKIINCSWKPLYIVTDRIRWTYKEILKWNKYTWDHFWEESPASKNKIIVDKNSCVLGAQLCAWGDVLVNYSSCELASKNEFKIIRENLPALSQSCWAEDSGILEEDFLKIFNHTNKVLGKIL